MKNLNRAKRIRTKKFYIHYENFGLFSKESTKFNNLQHLLNIYILEYLVPLFEEKFKSEINYVISADLKNLYCYLEFKNQVDLRNPYRKLKLDGNENTESSVYYQCLRSRKKIDPIIYKPSALWTNIKFSIASGKQFENRWEYLAALLGTEEEKNSIFKKLQETDEMWFALNIKKISLKIDQYQKYYPFL